MPGITDPQWEAIRLTAAAAARSEVRNLSASREDVDEMAAFTERTDHEKFKDCPAYINRPSNGFYFDGQIWFDKNHRRILIEHEDQVMFAGRMERKEFGREGSEVYYLGVAPPRAKFYLNGKFLDKNMRQISNPATGRVNHPREVSFASEPHDAGNGKRTAFAPTSEFFTVSQASAYKHGGSPERDMPWLASPGKVMHANEHQALKEAERLAQQNNVPTVVMKAVAVIHPGTGHTPINFTGTNNR